MVKKSFLGLIALVLTVSYSPSVFSEQTSFNEGNYESSEKTLSQVKYLGGGIASGYSWVWSRSCCAREI